jgi:hypothetical protein
LFLLLLIRNAGALARPDEIRQAAPDVVVATVPGDITTTEGRMAALSACPAPDILINNAGGPPPGDFREWSREDWIRAVDANMLTPIELMKATVDGMMERGFGRVVNITSSAVKAPIDILGLSNGARSGLTGFVAGLSRKTVSRGVPRPPEQPHDRRGTRGYGATEPCWALRNPRGVRRGLRVPLQRSRGLHHWAELAPRRRPISRNVLTPDDSCRRPVFGIVEREVAAAAHRRLPQAGASYVQLAAPKRRSASRSTSIPNPGPVGTATRPP